MLVSICIPCYNASPYLSATLNTLLAQTHQNLEIIVVDDHSTDNSTTIIRDFEQQDPRIKLFEATSKGASAARNQAFNLSQGNYIVFFDADDWVEPNFIEAQLANLKSDQEVVVCKWGRFIKDDINTITIDQGQLRIDCTFKEWILHHWKNNSNMTCPGRVFMPRQIVEIAGLWDEELTLNDDFPFYTRIFAKSHMIRYNDKSTFHYRSGINGLSSYKGDVAYTSLYNAITKGIHVAMAIFNDKEINLCCANLLQYFIYEAYPKQPKLIDLATQKIKTLGGSDLAYPAGGRTKTLNTILGWKFVKRLKNLI